MSSRPILQSHPSTATCPTALDPEPPALDAPEPQPAAAKSTSEAPGPRASAQVTTDGIDAELALRSGGLDYVDSEIASASVTTSSGQSTAQAIFARVDLHTGDRSQSLSLEALSAKASIGSINPDGSIGRNVSLGATLVGAEGTLTHSGNSVTGGLSLGAGAEVAIGTRDFDRDNRPEFCGRVSALVLTIGFCVEDPF